MSRKAVSVIGNVQVWEASGWGTVEGKPRKAFCGSPTAYGEEEASSACDLCSFGKLTAGIPNSSDDMGFVGLTSCRFWGPKIEALLAKLELRDLV
ncbi:hypothetical protein SAMN06265222_101174 [Neorhodopirellula lusitana]|uniref:Uncharacterized protein n=1 Tax=Neorhodopirellula lusitana TaxID=445327 RepID=A0ABY1PRH5_9BACT|nr:hypothetical protein SAMN06265222_101174 [Neorhodopirellula lusitana]